MRFTPGVRPGHTKTIKRLKAMSVFLPTAMLVGSLNSGVHTQKRQ